MSRSRPRSPPMLCRKRTGPFLSLSRIVGSSAGRLSVSSCPIGSMAGVEPSKDGAPAKDSDGSKFIAALAENEKSIGDLAGRIERIVDDFLSKREKARRTEREGRSRFVSKIIKWTFALIGLAVLGTGILTWYGVVPPEAFTGLVGILVGALITFLADHVAPYLYEAEEASPES